MKKVYLKSPQTEVTMLMNSNHIMEISVGMDIISSEPIDPGDSFQI